MEFLANAGFGRAVGYLDDTTSTKLPLLSDSEMGSVRTKAGQGLGPNPLCAWLCLL
jgi:hypothetical protein